MLHRASIALYAGLILFSAPVLAAFQSLQPLPKQPPIPADNPQTPAKIALGKQLYFDARLSSNGTRACNDCHNLMAGGDDNRAISIDALGRSGTRNAPTVWNIAFSSVVYRDGRAASLEALAKMHLLEEMGNKDAASITARLNAIPGYRTQFAKIFGGDAVTYDAIAQALAAYERTLITLNSPYDRYLRGNKKALSPAAQRGLATFQEVQCSSCHFWINLQGPVPGVAFQMGEGFYELFPNYLGSVYDEKYKLTADEGRYNVTQQEIHRRLWRVPTLRNVALTAPYFHNGAVATLDEAVRVMAKTQLNRDVTDQQVSDIVAFLNSLTGQFPTQTLPRLPPSATP